MMNECVWDFQTHLTASSAVYLGIPAEQNSAVLSFFFRSRSSPLWDLKATNQTQLHSKMSSFRRWFQDIMQHDRITVRTRRQVSVHAFAGWAIWNNSAKYHITRYVSLILTCCMSSRNPDLFRCYFIPFSSSVLQLEFHHSLTVWAVKVLLKFTRVICVCGFFLGEGIAALRLSGRAMEYWEKVTGWSRAPMTSWWLHPRHGGCLRDAKTTCSRGNGLKLVTEQIRKKNR